VSAWSDLITALATGREDPTLEDVNGRLTDRHVREWVEGQSPYAVIGEALEEVDHDLDGKNERDGMHARLLLNALVAPNPQTVVWRILRDSIRRNAIRAALYEAETEREKERERREDERDARGDYERDLRIDRELEERWEREHGRTA